MVERQNHPISMVFLDCMCTRTNIKAMSKSQDSDVTSQGNYTTAVRSNMGIDMETVLKERPMHVAHNRWHLALLLLKNPSLRKYRKHRLPPATATEHDTKLTKCAAFEVTTDKKYSPSEVATV